jgi:hypothetical protein
VLDRLKAALGRRGEASGRAFQASMAAALGKSLGGMPRGRRKGLGRAPKRRLQDCDCRKGCPAAGNKPLEAQATSASAPVPGLQAKAGRRSRRAGMTGGGFSGPAKKGGRHDGSLQKSKGPGQGAAFPGAGSRGQPKGTAGTPAGAARGLQRAYGGFQAENVPEAREGAFEGIRAAGRRRGGEGDVRGLGRLLLTRRGLGLEAMQPANQRAAREKAGFIQFIG